VDDWIPELRLYERADECRLELVGVTTGRGPSLTAAADDLVRAVLQLVMAIRSSGIRVSTDLGPPDRRVLDFVYTTGEHAARGEDVRELLFGSPLGDSGLAA
jgi:hypothetical protein